jgi:hypothetical protein
VLQDGGVLAGTYSLAGDRYVLTRNGSELQVSAGRVLVACRSLEEAYDERRKLIQQQSADSHLALAAWCLRHNLLPQAARELLDARGLEPNNRGVALLERRLAAAGSPRPERRRQVDTEMTPAMHVEMVSGNAEGQQLTIAIDDLPAGAIERFTRRVQPILVNNCTTSGCHQPGGQQDFHLDRALLRGLANRRSTMQNLAATLALLDREQPHLSRLLTVPRQAHGGMRSAVFGPRQAAAYAHLVDWVALVTNTDSPDDQPKAPAAQKDGEPAAMSDSYASEQGPAQELIANKDPRPATLEPLLEEMGGRRAAGRKVRFGAQLQSWQPKDPLDPEIFNLQQRQRATPSAEGS